MSKILLVEDDPMIAEIYMKKLESAGMEVENATNGMEVLVKTKKNDYDLILLDLVMPEMGGLDVLKKLKSTEKSDFKAKVVIFSNLSEERKRALEEGADGFILKSQFNPSQLVEEVNRILRSFGGNSGKKTESSFQVDGLHIV